jgi:hypothetical protein
VSLFCERGLNGLSGYNKARYNASQLYTLTPLILSGFL